MKRILALTLTLAVLLSSTACKGIGDSKNQQDISESTVEIAKKIDITAETSTATYPDITIEAEVAETNSDNDFFYNYYTCDDYTIKLFDGWESSGNAENMYMANHENSHNVSMTIVTTPVPQAVDLFDNDIINEFAKDFIDGFTLSGMIDKDNVELISSSEAIVDDLLAIRIELVTTLFNTETHMIVYAVFDYKALYMLMYTGIDGADYVSDFEEMVSTFKVNKNHMEGD